MALQTKTFSYGSLAYQSESNAYILDLILAEESVDNVANTSVVSYKLQLRSGPSNRFNGYLSASLVINGTQIAKTDLVTIAAAYNKTYTLLSGSTTLSHNNSGSLSLAASGGIVRLGETQTNPYAPPDMSVSGTMTLTQIPRASTLAATSVFIEDTTTILVSRKSVGYTHSIHYQFGAISGYLADSVGAHSDVEVKLIDTTILFPVPAAFYEQIPDKPSDLCTLTCKTYSGETQIGEAQTATFTVTADPARCGPSIGGTASDTNASTLALTGDDQILVQGVSSVLCDIQADAKRSATIASLFVNGMQIENTQYTIDAVPTATITFRAVDSRGYSAEYVVPGLSLIPYVPLSFYVTASRVDPTSGRVNLLAQGKWFNGSFGATDNELSARYRVNGGAWIYADVIEDDGNFVVETELSDLNYQQSHKIDIQLTDALQTLEKTATVSKGIPVFDWGDDDFAFHVPVKFTATDGTVFTLDLVDGQLIASI